MKETITSSLPLIHEFLLRLQKSNLLEPKTLSSVIEEEWLRQGPTVVEVAKRLMERGLLTQLQARSLLRGQHRGLIIDGYRLLEILGAGGMGNVYLAEDISSGKRFALKVLSDRQRLEPGLLARFQLEAHAGSRLNHPNIVRTYAFRQSEGLYGPTPYLAMEFIEGVSLQELVDWGGPLAWPQACDIICQVAEAIDYAHNVLIHRDIKPSNLLIDHDGTAKLLDFGLALIKDEHEDEFSLTMIFGHKCLGSVDYIAPEQSRDGLVADARADIYSLGCTLYHAISGTVPFPYGSPHEKVYAHRTKKAKPISEVAVLPARLAEIIERSMHKESCSRFESAAELAREVAPFAARKRVHFDFAKVLALRAKEARRRLRAFGHSPSTYPS